MLFLWIKLKEISLTQLGEKLSILYTLKLKKGTKAFRFFQHKTLSVKVLTNF